MRGTAATGWGLLSGALLLAVLGVAGLYSWDSAARAAEAALRPAPVAPLAPAAQTSYVPLVAATPLAAASIAAADSGTGDPVAGQEVFATACNTCHPSANAGIGPALYGPQFVERYPEDGPLVAVIRQGKGGMPAFSSGQLSDHDLANTIAYIRALGSGAIAAEPTPTPRPRQRGG